MTRILLNGLRVNSGGAVAHLHGMIRGLTNQDVEVVVCAPSDLLDNSPRTNVISKGILKRKSNIVLKCLYEICYLPVFIWVKKIDYVVCLDAGTFLWYGKRIVISQDLLSYIDFGKIEQRSFYGNIRLQVLKHLQIYNLNNANHAIFLTEYARNLCSKFGFKGEATIIPHGIDDYNLSVKSASEAYDRFMYVSNFVPYKNQLEIIEAFKKLRSEQEKVHLTLIGGGEGEYAVKVAASAEMYSWCTVIGSVNRSELESYYLMNDAVLFMSSIENMPVTLMEAMKSRKPIIASNEGPMPEMLSDNNILVNPKSIDEIVDAIKYLRKMSKKDVNNVVEENYRRVSEYTWRSSAIKLIEICKI